MRVRDSSTSAPVPNTWALRGRSGLWLHVIGLGIGLLVLGRMARDIEPGELVRFLRRRGPAAAVVLLPAVAGVAAHALAWRTLLGDALPKGRIGRLAAVHVAAEAIRVALPGGAALGEIAAARGVRALGVSWRDAIASLVRKRACVVATNGLWILALVGLGSRSETAMSTPLGNELTTLLVTAAVGLALAGLIALALVDPTARTLRLRDGTPLPEDGGGALPSRRSAAALGLTAALLLAQWALDASETWLALRLVDVHAAPVEAAVLESSGALARALAFFVPAGLGVQDASYLTVAQSLGLDLAAGPRAAFVVLKRARDIGLVLAGLIAALRLSLVVPRVALARSSENPPRGSA